jgi:hypothetical protein
MLTKIKIKFLQNNSIIFAHQMKLLLYKMVVLFTLLLFPAMKLLAIDVVDATIISNSISVENNAFYSSSSNPTSDFILLENDLLAADDDDDEVHSSKKKLNLCNCWAIVCQVYFTPYSNIAQLDIEKHFLAFSHLLPYSDYLSLRVIRI